MSWVKIDDGLCTHPKTYTLLDLDSIGLWTLCLSYCGQQLTDGAVPRRFVESRVPKPDRRGTVKALLDAGWFEELPSGDYLIPQYLDHNPSKAEDEERRREEREKKSRAGKAGAAARWGKRDGSGKADAMAGAIADATPAAKGNPMAPSRPLSGPNGPEARSIPKDRSDPSSLTASPSTAPKDKRRATAAERDRDPEYIRLSQLLAELVHEHGYDDPSPAEVEMWPKEIRLMVERDGRTLEEIEAAIRWSQRHSFWCGNVRSTASLRRNFREMRAQAKRDRAASSRAEGNAKVIDMLDRVIEADAA